LLLIAISFIITENVISGLLLTGVALFNTDDFSTIHNVLAVCFFLYTTYKVYNDKRYSYVAIPVLLSAILIPYITLFWFECVAVLCFSIHSTLYSIKKLKLFNNKS
jgi:hypothetical protein